MGSPLAAPIQTEHTFGLVMPSDPAVSLLNDESRKLRGAFFTPPAIASFLARWALHERHDAVVLDPTCGEGIFLLAAGEHLRELGSDDGSLDSQVFGVDVHEPSLRKTDELLQRHGLDAKLVPADFFSLPVPGELFQGPIPAVDAVIGNPPFVRYQHHIGAARRASAQAALRQGVRLSGLASSWAALLVHAGAFLKPSGRLAMVLPAELLTVGYAEPVRRWLRRRFANVNLVLFERLQFAEALENVVLLLAEGAGGCDAFKLFPVSDSGDLRKLEPFDGVAVSVSADGKWTDLLLNRAQLQLFRSVASAHFVGLSEYGAPELGTVTGANSFFTLNESVRAEYGLVEGDDVIRISPPGTRFLRGLALTKSDWDRLRAADESVWMLYPSGDRPSTGLRRYLKVGEEQGVPAAYKCTVRSPWWRPPAVSQPDLFFTYMSHRYPRLIANPAHVTFVNSMHGVRLRSSAPRIARDALALVALNSVTMLGAEVFGRSYGGGILKMEPREAAALPVPQRHVLEAAWEILRPERAAIDRQLRNGLWTTVVTRVDQVVLRDVLKLSADEAEMVHQAVLTLRSRRLSRAAAAVGD